MCVVKMGKVLGMWNSHASPIDTIGRVKLPTKSHLHREGKERKRRKLDGEKKKREEEADNSIWTQDIRWH